MTTTVERLRTTLAALSLTAIDARLETLLESASKKEPAYGDFLLEVMSAEADARRQRYLNRQEKDVSPVFLLHRTAASLRPHGH